jgi:hypothetical protein
MSSSLFHTRTCPRTIGINGVSRTQGIGVAKDVLVSTREEFDSRSSVVSSLPALLREAVFHSHQAAG